MRARLIGAWLIHRRGQVTYICLFACLVTLRNSFARALDLALERGWKTALIIEDDFMFAHSPGETLRLLLAFFDRAPSDWDFAFLAYGTGSVEPLRAEQGSGDFLARSLGVKAGSAYLIQRHMMADLRDVFLRSADLLLLHHGEPENCPSHASDVVWLKIQRERRCFLFLPKLGYQKGGLSNIKGGQTFHCMGADRDGSGCIRI